MGADSLRLARASSQLGARERDDRRRGRTASSQRPAPDGSLPALRGTAYANMCSVTSQGHPYSKFRRALATGNPRIAEVAAREVRRLSLADALDLCLLYRGEPAKYERAAARWIARLIEERPGLHLAEIELAAAGFREALHQERVETALRGLLEVGRFSND